MTNPLCRVVSLSECILLTLGFSGGLAAGATSKLELSGLTVTPHLQLDSMRYSRAPEPPNGARVQLFLRHTASGNAAPLLISSDAPIRFNKKTPAELSGPAAGRGMIRPPLSRETESNCHGGAHGFGLSTAGCCRGELRSDLDGTRPRKEAWLSTNLTLAVPNAWLSAVTFLAPEGVIEPDLMMVHLANDANEPLSIRSCRSGCRRIPARPACSTLSRP